MSRCHIGRSALGFRLASSYRHIRCLAERLLSWPSECEEVMSEEGEREEEEEGSAHTSDEEEQEDPKDYCKGQSPP